MGWTPTRRRVLQATGSGLAGGGLCSSGTTAVTAQTLSEEWTEFGYNGNTGHAPNNTGIDAGGIFATVTQKWDSQSPILNRRRVS